MKKHGIQITKGRGISFADEKKVKVKGSGLGYSLQAIERILEKKAMLQEKPAIAGTGSALQLSTPAYKDNSLPDNIQKDTEKIIELVIKPEQTPEPINLFLKQNRKRRKKRSLHL